MRKQFLPDVVPHPSRSKPVPSRTRRPMASLFHPVDKLTPEEQRLDITLLQFAANTALFPALCRQAKGGCFRAQRCRGNANECVGRFTELVPEDAWDFVQAAMEGMRTRRPFDDVVAEHPDEYEALNAWRATLKLASGW